MVIVDKEKMTVKVVKRPIVSMLLFLIMAVFGAIEVYIATSKLADGEYIFHGALWFLISLNVFYYGIKEFATIAKLYFSK